MPLFATTLSQANFRFGCMSVPRKYKPDDGRKRRATDEKLNDYPGRKSYPGRFSAALPPELFQLCGAIGEIVLNLLQLCREQRRGGILIGAQYLRQFEIVGLLLRREFVDAPGLSLAHRVLVF